MAHRSAVNPSSASIPEPNAPVTIGEAEGLGFVNGLIDELAAYSRALSPGEIQAIFQAAGASKGGNLIKGNFIGTNAAGTAALANFGNGITISNSADNTIGGNVSGAGNVISGNNQVGVEITGIGTNNNWVAGNFIGTNAPGTVALGNGGGVAVHGGAQFNIIGTTGDGVNDAAERNV